MTLQYGRYIGEFWSDRDNKIIHIKTSKQYKCVLETITMDINNYTYLLNNILYCKNSLPNISNAYSMPKRLEQATFKVNAYQRVGGKK